MLTHDLMALGSWTLTLKPNTPQAIKDALFAGDFSHVFFTNDRLPNLDVDLRAVSTYTGILLKRREIDPEGTEQDAPRGLEIGGPGLTFWLGNAQDRRGPVARSLELNHTFPNAIREFIPDSLAEGTLHNPGGPDIVHSVKFAIYREAIEYLCSLKSAEYRVNPDLTVDAGTVAQLYPSATKPILITRKAEGGDPNYRPMNLTSAMVESSREDYVTDSILVAEGEGDAIATGEANLTDIGQGPTPFRDYFGNPVQRTILAAESNTEAPLADLRAMGILAKSAAERIALSLEADQYDIRVGDDEADARAGDYVEVYDPTTPVLVDLSREGRYRGEVIHPRPLRVVSTAAPVTEDMGCYVQDGFGNKLDLSDYFVPEEGSVQIQVGDFSRSIGNTTPAEPINPRVTGDPSVPGLVTKILPWQTAPYQDAEGFTRALMVLTWGIPLNVDGSTIVDGAFYQIRWKRAASTQYQYTAVPWGVNTAQLMEMATGGEYDFDIRGVDGANPPNFGEWAGDVRLIVAPDTIAPSTPAAPTVAGDAMTLQVKHLLGKASGGTFNLERDLRGIVVFADPDPDFVPSDANKLGEIPAGSADLTVQAPAIGDFPIPLGGIRTVKVKAVDNAGNLSAASAGAEVTVPLVGSLNIGEATITDLHVATVSASKLRSGAIETALMDLVGAGQLRAGRDAAPFNYIFLDANGIYSARNGSAKYVGGTPALVYNLATGDLELNGADINAGDIIGATYRTSSGGRRVVIDPTQHFIEFYSGSSGEALPAVITQHFYGTEGTASRGASLILRAPQFSGIRGGELELYAHSANGSLVRQALLRSSSNAGGAFVRVQEGRCLLGSSFSFPNYIELNENDGQIYYKASNAGHVYQITDKIAFEIEHDRVDVWVGMSMNWSPVWLRVAGSVQRLEYDDNADSSDLHGVTRAKLFSWSGGVMVKADLSGAVEARDVGDGVFRAMYASAFTINSDPEIKQDVAPIATPLARLRNMRTGLVEYRHKPEHDPDKPSLRHVKTGILADHADEMVQGAAYLRDGDGKPYPTRMVDLAAYVSLVAAAVVELSDLVDEDRPAGRKIKAVPRRPTKALPSVAALMGVDSPGQLSSADRIGGTPASRPKPREATTPEENIAHARNR